MLLYEIIQRQKFQCEKGVHPNSALLIVLEGSFTCQTLNNKYEVKENDVFYFRANIPFERRVVKPLTCIYIQFDQPLPAQESGLLALRDPIRARSTQALLAEAINAGETVKIAHYVNDLMFLSHPCAASHPVKPEQTVAACLEFLRSHYADTITLDSLAQRFYISKQWLIRKFKAETQRTPMEYLKSIRLRQAQELLIHTEMPIGEIAINCGYDNIYYFSKDFKKTFLIPPKEYRSRMKL